MAPENSIFEFAPEEVPVEVAVDSRLEFFTREVPYAYIRSLEECISDDDMVNRKLLQERFSGPICGELEADTWYMEVDPSSGVINQLFSADRYRLWGDYNDEFTYEEMKLPNRKIILSRKPIQVVYELLKSKFNNEGDLLVCPLSVTKDVFWCAEINPFDEKIGWKYLRVYKLMLENGIREGLFDGRIYSSFLDRIDERISFLKAAGHSFTER